MNRNSVPWPKIMHTTFERNEAHEALWILAIDRLLLWCKWGLCFSEMWKLCLAFWFNGSDCAMTMRCYLCITSSMWMLSYCLHYPFSPSLLTSSDLLCTCFPHVRLCILSWNWNLVKIWSWSLIYKYSLDWGWLCYQGRWLVLWPSSWFYFIISSKSTMQGCYVCFVC